MREHFPTFPAQGCYSNTSNFCSLFNCEPCEATEKQPI